MTKKAVNEQNLQQMYMQLQYIEEQSKQLDHEAQAVEQKRNEFDQLLSQLDVLPKSKTGTKVFSNIGAGILAQTKIENTKEFLVNIGAGNFVKKSLDEVKASLKMQVEEFTKVQTQITENIQMHAIQAEIIQSQMQKELGM